MTFAVVLLIAAALAGAAWLWKRVLSPAAKLRAEESAIRESGGVLGDQVGRPADNAAPGVGGSLAMISDSLLNGFDAPQARAEARIAPLRASETARIVAAIARGEYADLVTRQYPTLAQGGRLGSATNAFEGRRLQGDRNVRVLVKMGATAADITNAMVDSRTWANAGWDETASLQNTFYPRVALPIDLPYAYRFPTFAWGATDWKIVKAPSAGNLAPDMSRILAAWAAFKRSAPTSAARRLIASQREYERLVAAGVAPAEARRQAAALLVAPL